jgi:hypothetical protein
VAVAEELALRHFLALWIGMVRPSTSLRMKVGETSVSIGGCPARSLFILSEVEGRTMVLQRMLGFRLIASGFATPPAARRAR